MRCNVNIDDMNIETLQELNEIICERIDYLRAKQDQEALIRLQLGSQVHFESKHGATVFGIVVKINRKTVIVMSQAGKQWKISPGLLTLVTDIKEI